MAEKKVVFIAFAIEDQKQRDLLKGKALNTASPFEYVDMPVKEPHDNDWEEQVRMCIRRSDGVIALVSKNTTNSIEERWEINCAKDEKKKLIGLWVYNTDRTKPDVFKGHPIIVWIWDNITKFIDSL